MMVTLKGGKPWLAAGVLVLTLFATVGLAPRRPRIVTFPSGFLWGAATSSHQVEGGNTNNDWYEWEQAGHTPEPSGRAANEYQLYSSDLALAASLGHNANRLSVEWSRLEPSQGVFDYNEVRHYRDVLRTARAHGLKTFVTLHHFTNPIWAARQGGWANSQMPGWFAQYAAFIVPRLGDLVDFWITINEPNVYAITGFVAGATPPGLKDTSKLGPVLANLLKGHAAAYHVIHRYFPAAKVSIAHHMRSFVAASFWNPLDQLIVYFVDDLWNNQLLKSIKSGHISISVPFLINYDEWWPELANTLDYVGVNYYTQDVLQFDLSSPQKFNILTSQDPALWRNYPHGIYEMVTRAASFGYPVYITENGVDDSTDSRRAGFLCEHLQELGHAIEDGVDVRGYIHWALIDNFEWTSGYTPRFGLIGVDYASQARTVRPSARRFKSIIVSNSLASCI